MLFSSLEFLIFFGIYFILHFFITANSRVYLVITGSLIFYAYWQPLNVFVPISLSVAAWLGGLWVENTQNTTERKTRMLVLVCTLLLPLIFFKYSSFIYTSVFNLNNPQINFPSEIPIGISFITFTAIAYVVEIHRRNFPAQTNFKDVFQYVLFFPQLIAGPILRPAELLNQLKFPTPAKNGLFMVGNLFFIIGLVKKVFFADQIGIYIDPIWNEPSLASNEEIISAFYGFAIQIYMDFSGYTDMAIGLALMLGVNLPSNFDSPYLATDISQFWRRWHITLSNWLRDYVYIPLGGNRNGSFNQKKNLILTMIIGGLWHGAGWNFLFWGAYHGLLLAITNIFKSTVRIQLLPKIIGVFITFHLVCIGWVFFRANNFSEALTFLLRLAGTFSDPLSINLHNFETSAVILILLPLMLHYLDKRSFIETLPKHISIIILTPILVVLLLMCLILSYTYTSAFIYFDF
jgi:D-alanyl-lipoteichoic acid acyltransferase DltB (MBOAT superfamily)